MVPADAAAQPPAETNKIYELPELIDLALRQNPSTRQQWASARAAAAAFGAAKAPYYPMASFEGDGGYTKFQFQDQGTEIVIKQWQYTPMLALTYTLLDFGRRSAAADAARQQLAAANFSFNRKIQDVVFGTQRAFYALSASKAAVEAARKNVELTKTDVDAVSQRLDLGLATEPALLLARQRMAQAGYDLENAKLLVRDAQADLAVALGMAANTPLDVRNLDRQPMPRELGATVDQLILAAVKQRPDLAAQVAALRQREAELRRTKAAWYPTVGLSAGYGDDLWSYNFNSLHVVETRVPQYSALWRHRPGPKPLPRRGHLYRRLAARNGHLRRARIRPRGFRQRPAFAGERIVPSLRSYAGSDACRVVLAGADAAFWNQPGTCGAHAPVPACAQLGFVAPARLLCSSAVSASCKRGPPYHVCVDLRELGERFRKLGSHLRPSWIPRHGNCRLWLVHMLGSRLHGRLPRDHTAVGRIKTVAAGGAGMMKIDVSRMAALLQLGAPAASQILFEIGAFSAAAALCAKLGPIPLAGHQIALNCAALTFMVPLGIQLCRSRASWTRARQT